MALAQARRAARTAWHETARFPERPDPPRPAARPASRRRPARRSPLLRLPRHRPASTQWRDNFRARALAKGISDATWTRVMGRIEPDMSACSGRCRSSRNSTSRSGNTSIRRASDWRIINGREALKKNEALFARIEQDFGVERGTLLALWGVEIRLWRSAGAAEPYAPGISVARSARLERAAPPRLLGNRADQRAEDRRPRLGHAGGNARLLGRRDGPYAVDAGSLAQCRHGLRQGRPRLAVRQARRCARLQRALSAQPRQVSPRRTLGL